MHRLVHTVVGALVAAGFAGAAAEPRFTSPADATSYCVGYQIGSDLRRHGLAMDPDLIAAGVRDALSGAEPKLSPEDMRVRLADLQRQMRDSEKRSRQDLSVKAKAEGRAFLSENGKREGVVTLPSGLQYEVLTEGEGEPPSATDAVTVHYRGTLIDGTEFDSSYSRNQPATFALNRVVKGWTEGLQLMKPGARYKLFLPSELAYGERGAGSKIGPNSALVFEVELLSVGGR